MGVVFQNIQQVPGKGSLIQTSHMEASLQPGPLYEPGGPASIDMLALGSFLEKAQWFQWNSFSSQLKSRENVPSTLTES